jgi:hypothetical protein
VKEPEPLEAALLNRSTIADMESSQQSTPTSSPRVPLLPGFLSIKQFQNLENKALKGGQIVNVVGFLKDFQPPVLTKGSGMM